MRRWTLAEIKTKIQQDLDLEAEDFVQETELLAYINEGIDECEAQIHLLGREERYFLTAAWIALVTGTDEYALPSDIYARKIKRLIYINGTDIYVVKKMRSEDMFERMEEADRFDTSADYEYIFVNKNVTDGDRIKISPASRETRTQGLRLWYLRNANRLFLDADVCDIPEFVYYVIAFAKFQILSKEGNPAAIEAKAELDKQKLLMQETLGSNSDEDDKLIGDYSHYDEAT